MQFDRAKLKDLILFACAQCDPSQMGAVKLHKVLYFSDMLHYADVGAPISGATYKKRPMGPTCEQLLLTISELSAEGKLDVTNVDYFGYLKKQYVCKIDDIGRSLSDLEKLLVKDVVDFVCVNNTARTISEFSHNKAWDAAEFGEELPYFSVFQIFPAEVSEEAKGWAEREALELETERSTKDPLDFVAFSDFRKRVHAAGI